MWKMTLLQLEEEKNYQFKSQPQVYIQIRVELLLTVSAERN